MMANKPICTIDGCGKPAERRGWCGAHYQRWNKHGDPLAADRRLRPPKTCSVEGCDGDAGWRAGGKRGMCQKHWARWRHNGDPTVTRKRPNGTLAAWIVDHATHEGEDCLIWPFTKAKDGYAGYATIDGFEDYAYRHMCRLANGEPPSVDSQARHLCGRGHVGCAHPKHVVWGTPAENQADRLVHGTDSRGEKAASSKLTESDVREIRALAHAMKQKDIAVRYGVTRHTIYAVVAGKSWAWLR